MKSSSESTALAFGDLSSAFLAHNPFLAYQQGAPAEVESVYSVSGKV